MRQHVKLLAPMSTRQPKLALLLIALPLALLLSGASLAQTGPQFPGSPAPVVNQEFDADGNPTRSILAPGQAGFAFATSNSYDGLQRLRSSTDARGARTVFVYDSRDAVVSISDPRYLLTNYQRDGLGQLTRLSSPDTGTTSQTFDAAGNLVSSAKGRFAQTTAYSHDSLNRITSAVYGWGSGPPQMHTWRYDETGAGFSNGIGRLTSTTYQGGGSRFAYDAQGRLLGTTQTTETGPGSALALQTGYQYDAAGHVVQMVYPSGRVLTVQYSGGLPVAVYLAANGAAAVPLMTNIRHEPFGAVRRWAWALDAGPQWHERVTDTWGRMVRYPLGTAQRDLAYDAADRISSMTHWDRNTGAATAATNAMNQRFTYDEPGRLTAATGTGGNWLYAYDVSGNRIITVNNGVASSYTSDGYSNRLLYINNPQRSFNHDTVGNTVSDTKYPVSLTAGYDPANRLATLSTATAALNTLNPVTSTVGYLYNTFGQRVAKVSAVSTFCQNTCATSAPASQAVVYVYNQQGQLLGEYRAADGAVLREYVWLDNMPVAVVAPDAVAAGASTDIFYIHADHLGTPRAVVDRAGRQRWLWLGEPFGASPPNSNPQGLGVFNFNLRFPGQYFDAESGLVYNHHRVFDPTLGRYTQSDPIGLAGGINTYAYVGGNPVSFVDPTGLDWIWSQSGGTLINTNYPGIVVGTGYAGHGNGVNNPALQGSPGIGPLPQGGYTIQPQQTNVTGTGVVLPGSMRLRPDPTNNMLNRAGFLIHGGNMSTQTSSAGCVVLPLNVRNTIGGSGDNRLVVGP